MKRPLTDLPLAKTEDQIKFWKQFRPINIPAASDTYKRTMSGSSNLFAMNFATYNLAARKAIKEKGADDRIIISGLEKMMYPWFMNPVTNTEVDKAEEFFTKHGAVKKFPREAWNKVLENDGYFPVDIFSLPGGQTILVKDGKHVPIMSVEGIGALVSHLEPHLENMFEGLIQATKAKLFEEVTGKSFAEFGLRSDRTLNNHIALLINLKVGGNFKLTSDDQAVLLFPELFQDIGTVGHEFAMAYQRKGKSLEDSQRIAYKQFVSENERSALLPDIVHTEYCGMPLIIELIKDNEGNGKLIYPRFDSGDVPEQCVIWKNKIIQEGINNENAPIDNVVEDGYNPEKTFHTKKKYVDAGFDSDKIFPGAGGYFQEGVTRDANSVAFKRSGTVHEGIFEPSLKFSDSPGKESVPGMVRVYEKDKTLIVAQAGEDIDAIPLMQKIVSNGHILYKETLQQQYERGVRTWNKYDSIEYSPKTQLIIAERLAEKKAIIEKYEKSNS